MFRFSFSSHPVSGFLPSFVDGWCSSQSLSDPTVCKVCICLFLSWVHSPHQLNAPWTCWNRCQSSSPFYYQALLIMNGTSFLTLLLVYKCINSTTPNLCWKETYVNRRDQFLLPNKTCEDRLHWNPAPQKSIFSSGWWSKSRTSRRLMSSFKQYVSTRLLKASLRSRRNALKTIGLFVCRNYVSFSNAHRILTQAGPLRAVAHCSDSKTKWPLNPRRGALMTAYKDSKLWTDRTQFELEGELYSPTTE